MIPRVAFVLLVGLVCTGCGTLGSSMTPSAEGRDALGKQIYALSGDRLANLEATANSTCPGTSRPYMKTVTGYGDNVSVTYTCE